MSTTSEILSQLSSGEITEKEAEKLLEGLKEKVTFKVSEKGAISFYKIRRMPITLYREELDTILRVCQTAEFKTFLEENGRKLSSKK